MRLYTFVNFYLSDIQRGIQTAHLVHEMFSTYFAVGDTARRTALTSWAELHKTIIVCNGGMASDIDKLYDDIHYWQRFEKHYQLPYESFYEEISALNGALTVVGIVLPADIYDAKIIPWGAVKSDGGESPRFKVQLANDEMDAIIIDDNEPEALSDVEDPLQRRAWFIKKLKSYRLA